jgi:hypothetical protein
MEKYLALLERVKKPEGDIRKHPDFPYFKAYYETKLKEEVQKAVQECERKYLGTAKPRIEKHYLVKKPAAKQWTREPRPFQESSTPQLNPLARDPHSGIYAMDSMAF